jgi:hypothetical protein
MDKKKEILSLEILYESKEELDVLLEDEDFHQLILDEALKVITEAIEQESGDAKIAYVSNIASSVLVHKNNFKEVLDTVLKFYEKKEDYTKCSEIVKLKDKI